MPQRPVAPFRLAARANRHDDEDPLHFLPDSPNADRLTRILLAVAMVDDGLADDHSPTSTENPPAGLETSTMVRAYDLCLGDGPDQHQQTRKNNGSSHIYCSLQSSPNAATGASRPDVIVYFLVASPPCQDLLFFAKHFSLRPSHLYRGQRGGQMLYGPGLVWKSSRSCHVGSPCTLITRRTKKRRASPLAPMPFRSQSG